MFGASPRAQPPDVNGPLDALARWSREQGDKVAYTFVDDRGVPSAALTYGELDRRTDIVARHLRFAAKVEAGARVLLVYPPGLDFIVAFIACLRAGVIAVPVFPPDPTRLTKDLALFTSTQASSGAKVALTNSQYNHAKKVAGLMQLVRKDGGKWPDLTWHVTDQVSDAPPGELSAPEPDSVAFLQYTSGSTAEPKGVRITHANLAHNLRWIMHALQVDQSTVEVSWLPQYHDMGLIGSYLGLLCCGGEGWYMSPFSFIKNPTLWVRLLSEKRGTHTQAPSFAYALTARKWEALPGAQRPRLNLASVRHMINGAEPIDPEAMAAFVRSFAPHGLRKDVVLPTYGLAEHTVFVCTGGRAQLSVDRAALEGKREVCTVSQGASGATVVIGCGSSPEGSGMRIRIVDPETRKALGKEGSDTGVGEIWLSSESVADGYWTGDGRGTARAKELRALTEETFGALIAGEEAGGVKFLRTGDLGFVHGGELFVCGRQKDLLIVRGRNHYPQDLERSAEKGSPEIRPGSLAVFAVPAGEAAAAKSGEARDAAKRAAGTAGNQGGAEILVCVAEVRAEHAGKARQVAEAVLTSVSAAHAVTLHAVVIIKQGTIFKTKSGKISRSRTRKDFLGASETPLTVLHALTAPDGAGGAQPTARAEAAGAGAAQTASSGDPARVRAMAHKDLVAELRERIAPEAGLDPSQLDPRKPLLHLGIGSMELVQIRGMIQSLYALDIEETTLATEEATIDNLAKAIKASAPSRAAAGPGLLPSTVKP